MPAPDAETTRPNYVATVDLESRRYGALATYDPNHSMACGTPPSNQPREG